MFLRAYFIIGIQDPIVDKTKDKEEAEQAVLKQLKPDGIIPLKAEILKHLDGIQRENLWQSR